MATKPKKDEPPPLPRCINCGPAYAASAVNPHMGLCRRYPQPVRIGDDRKHYCLEHPAFRTAPPTPADLKP